MTIGSSKIVFLILFEVVTALNAFKDSEGKTINVKLGFDLNEGPNGAQALSVQRFEATNAQNEPQLRAQDQDNLKAEDGDNSKSIKNISADSLSHSDEGDTNRERKEPGKVPIDSDDNSDNDDSDGNGDSDTQKSTRGIESEAKDDVEGYNNINARKQGVTKEIENANPENVKKGSMCTSGDTHLTRVFPTPLLAISIILNYLE